MNYKNRISAVREYILKNKADAVLISSPHNKFYLGNLYSSSGYIFITEQSQYIIVDFRYYEEVKSKNSIYEVVLLTGENTIYKIINSIIVRENLKVLGLEGKEISYDAYMRFNNLLKCELISLDTSKIRMIKDKYEIDTVKRACEIADDAFYHILNFIKEGVSEKSVENELVRFIKEKGGQKESFDTIVASGSRGALPHGKASEKIIKSGEMITLDFGVKYNNYCSDITRTVALGFCSDKLKHVYSIVKAAGEEAMKAAKPGMSLEKLDSIARKYIEKEGFGEYFGHNLGHGLGVLVHEYPDVSPDSKEILKEGMIITVEPGIYLPGIGGVRIEEDVLIVDKGCLRLTESSRDLMVI